MNLYIVELFYIVFNENVISFLTLFDVFLIKKTEFDLEPVVWILFLKIFICQGRKFDEDLGKFNQIDK